MRGIRWDERPPDVGPNNAWWGRYKSYADRCRRLCWLNTDCRHVCGVAILGRVDWLPWEPAKVLFQHQRDFNYVEERHLWEDAVVDAGGIHLAGMRYEAVLAMHEPDARAGEAIQTLEEAGRLLRCGPDTPADRASGLCRWVGRGGCVRRTGGGGVAGAAGAKGWTGLVDAV